MVEEEFEFDEADEYAYDPSALNESGCAFCAVAIGELNVPFLYEDEKLYVVRELKPQAPEHLLIVPFVHLGRLHEEEDSALELMARMLVVAKKMATDLGLQRNGYRLVINQGRDAGQEISHLHVHLLAGRQLEGMG